MAVDPRRIKKQNAHEYISGPVLYWMNRDMRLSDNWALLHAQEQAHYLKTELVICYNLDPQFLGGTLRQLDFKIGALKQLVERAHTLNIPLYVVVGNDISCVVDFMSTRGIGMVVTDFSPLRIAQQWLMDLVAQSTVPVTVVDTHNIVPIWEASAKKEFAAYTLRPKINRQLKEFLVPFPKLKKQDDRTIPFQVQDLDLVQKEVQTNRAVLPVTWCTPGEVSAHKVLKHFLVNLINEYDQKRNDPVHDVQSQLSPYLHYGMISAQRVALEVQKSDAHRASVEAFLEELIIRKELADNFCYYEKNYDNPKGFHQYFVEEHERIKNIKRDFVYSLEEFEHAKTHDELWNACQMQMRSTGKMHGYLRMYWAKMIFAWSKNVDEAMRIAIYLNDTYLLDGRDPNGYTGIAWCIGGVHDRPWFPSNLVFGKLRYMSRNGMNKKFEVKEYISKWLNSSLF